MTKKIGSKLWLYFTVIVFATIFGGFLLISLIWFLLFQLGYFSVKVSENQHIDEIREMSERFNAMTFDLSHIETLRNDFVVNVSHEFKTPIAAIEGYATLLQNPELSSARHEHYVEKILGNSKKHIFEKILSGRLVSKIRGKWIRTCSRQTYFGSLQRDDLG